MPCQSAQLDAVDVCASNVDQLLFKQFLSGTDLNVFTSILLPNLLNLSMILFD